MCAKVTLVSYNILNISRTYLFLNSLQPVFTIDNCWSANKELANMYTFLSATSLSYTQL